MEFLGQDNPFGLLHLFLKHSPNFLPNMLSKLQQLWAKEKQPQNTIFWFVKNQGLEIGVTPWNGILTGKIRIEKWSN